MTKELEKSKEEALWGMFVADALSMPVHWYYNPDDIKHGYGGWLTGYRVPEKQHPSSILTLSSTGWYFDIVIYRLVFGHCHLHNIESLCIPREFLLISPCPVWSHLTQIVRSVPTTF